MHVESDEILVSFDVSSLFTNVPVGEAVSIICERIREDGENGGQDLSLPGTNCRSTGDVPKVHLLQLWREPISAEGRGGNGLPSLCCGGQPLHGVLALETAPTRPRL